VGNFRGVGSLFYYSQMHALIIKILNKSPALPPRIGLPLAAQKTSTLPCSSMCSPRHLLYFGSTQPGDVLDPPLDCRDSLFLGVIPGAFWSLSFCSWLKCLSAFLDDDCCPFWPVEEGMLDLSLCLALLVRLVDVVKLFAAVLVILDRWNFKMFERLPMIWCMRQS